MEDENGLELSLALHCGGSSGVSKNINCSSSDLRTDEDDRGKKLIDDFKNFLNGGTDPGLGSIKKDSSKPEENFFNNLSKATEDTDASTNLNKGGIWAATDNNRASEVEEAKRGEIGCKRKNLFDEINQNKKHEKEVHHADLHEKRRASHISITTDDGSTAENEDVADSETEASTSRIVRSPSVRFVGSGGSSEACKEIHGVSDSNDVELQGQKRFTIKSEDFKVNALPYGVSFPTQSVNIMNMPYSLPTKESNRPGTPSMSSYPSMLQVIPSGNNERSGTLPVMPVMFGYSPVQLPVLDKDSSQGLVPVPQQLQRSYSMRGSLTLDKQSDALKISQAAMPVIPYKTSNSVQHDARMLEQVKSDGNQRGLEEGSSSKTEDDVKGSSGTLKSKDASEPPKAEGFPFEFPAIRPGIAADIKFGGCGSYPNLPWVSTTGNGPNGKTISGVTYRYSATQIRIVCACHGSHMSAEEFIQHANNEDQSNGTGLASFPNNNHASAQS